MQSLAPDNPDTLSFDTEVASVDGANVVLEETYFYAESGGQPADSGVIDDIEVVDVQEYPFGVVHALADEDHGLAAGETVHCVVDAAFRTYCRRAHTASHVLFGAGRRVLEDVGYAGFDIDAEKVRVDFTADSDITDERLVEMERLANRAVWDSLPVTWEYQSPETARDREEVAFNTKTEEGVMSEADEVRVVTVEGWDVAACGGTHLRNTEEIGPIRVLDRSNPGEGATRVEFAVGPVGIDTAAESHGAARAAAAELDVAIPGVPDAVGRLKAERDELQGEVRELKAELLEHRLADLEPVERDGESWLVGAVEGFSPNDLQGDLQELAGDEANVVAVAGSSGETFVVVATDGSEDANEIVGDVTEEFGGGGGGGPTFAQGGGIPVSPMELVGYLRE
ncbi:MAG: alanine--tRNA ligase-related protein [Halolamina sp.]|uniref:alanine--tRNA ligase-related protein n=1 Tax=Halolamina sp. TaxID=1940283 RepID=UPI002FC2F4E2